MENGLFAPSQFLMLSEKGCLYRNVRKWKSMKRNLFLSRALSVANSKSSRQWRRRRRRRRRRQIFEMERTFPLVKRGKGKVGNTIRKRWGTMMVVLKKKRMSENFRLNFTVNFLTNLSL